MVLLENLFAMFASWKRKFSEIGKYTLELDVREPGESI